MTLNRYKIYVMSNNKYTRIHSNISYNNKKLKKIKHDLIKNSI